MVNILWIVLGFGGFIVLIGLIFLAFWLFKRKKYEFLYYTLDKKNIVILTAKIRVDPTNVMNKKFFFKGFPNMLEIREPTRWIAGKPYREVAQNPNGELSYIKDVNLDFSGYYNIAVSPEERQITLSRLKDNQRRYENPIGKAQAYMVIGGFILVLLIGVGIIYSTTAYVNASDNMVKLANENKEQLTQIKVMQATNTQVVEQLARIASALTNDKNLTRQLS